MMEKTVKNVLLITGIIPIITLLLLLCTQVNASAAVYTVPEGKETQIDFGTSYSTTVNYYKIKPSKTGVIQFQLSESYSGYATLCNSSKKVLSRSSKSGDRVNGGSQSYEMFVYYGVKKGRTYYVRVKGSSSRYLDGHYWGQVKWTSKSISTNKYGSKKSKAKAMKRKSTLKGLYIAGQSNSRWYKVTTKRKTIHLTFKAPKTNGAIKVTRYMRYYGHTGSWTTSTYYSKRDGTYNNLTLTNPNGTKWTVYFKVQRDNKSSGNYTLRWY